LVACREQGRVAVGAAILEAKGKAGRRAELGNGRWHERKDEGVAQLRERTEGAAGDRLRGVRRALALVPGLQRHEGKRRVLAAAGEAESEHADPLVDFGLLQEEGLRLL